MGIMDTIRSWFGGSEREELGEPESEAATDEVAEVRTDDVAAGRLGGNVGEFAPDDTAPRP